MNMEGEKIITSLSLAVKLLDDYTGEEPRGNISVRTIEENISSVRNLSGYYLFMGIKPGNYAVVIDSDFYFPEIRIVDTSLLDPKNPSIIIILIPLPVYPFPDNATLVRGLVSEIIPVADAKLKVIGKTIETRTDDNGEFVLYFERVKNKDKEEDISIKIEKSGSTKVVATKINEYKTRSLGTISFP